jgi:hypothetical protein
MYRKKSIWQGCLRRLSVIVTALLFGFPVRAETLAFQILRNGNQIGTHSMSFERGADEINVTAAIDITFKLAFITLYRFVHEGHELWRNGQLVSMDTTTNDDGTKHRLIVRADEETFRISIDGRDFQAPRMALSSLWRGDYPVEGTMLDIVDASLLKVQSHVIGEERIATPEGMVVARHLEIRGDLIRDIWFDSSGALLRMLFPADDGSQIEYRRFSPVSSGR